MRHGGPLLVLNGVIKLAILHLYKLSFSAPLLLDHKVFLFDQINILAIHYALQYHYARSLYALANFDDAHNYSSLES